MSRPALSVALVCWQMSREVPRTLWSLSRGFQKGMEGIDYEIIVVDNGSDQLPELPDMDPLPSIRRAQSTSSSPVGAMNEALALAQGDFVGAWIDGARLASPGLLRSIYDASRLHSNPVLAVPNWQLGPKRQAISAAEGYCTDVEDELLEQAGWPSRDIDLFSVSAPEMSGIKAPMLESNALFLSRRDWVRSDGYDAGFSEAGGGMANPDMLHRAVDLPETQLIRLSGEATFHQIHGGTTTDGPERAVEAVKQASRHYFKLRGHPVRPVRQIGWIYDTATGQIDKGT